MSLEVLIADDHFMFAESVANMLQASGCTIRGVIQHRDELPSKIDAFPQCLLVVDFNMPGLSLPELLTRTQGERAAERMLLITGSGSYPNVRQLLHMGIAGFILKDYAFEELLHALQCVAQGQRYVCPKLTAAALEHDQATPLLTNRQWEVLCCVADGLPSKSIASKLKLHVKTVDSHRQHIMAKLRVHSAAEMVSVAKDIGLI